MPIPVLLTADEEFQRIHRCEATNEVLSRLARTLEWGSYPNRATEELKRNRLEDLKKDHIRNILLTQGNLDFTLRYVLLWLYETKQF
jgi:hypothetical protein